MNTPDEMAVLWPSSWQGLQQQIVYLAQFGNSVQVIHGEAGAGKTTFFNRLLQRDFGRSAVGVRAESHSSIEFFFRSILDQLGLRPDPHATRGELIAALRSFVQTLHKERSRTVLLVDDAHELSDPELGALVSLLQGHSDAGFGLHIVMFAEPGFAARLDALGVLDVEVHDAPLPALSPSEAHGLLRQLETSVGFTLESSDQAQRLWNQSRGLPGRILELAHQLRPAPNVEKALSLRGLPIGHFAALVLLSGVLIWAFLVRSPEDSPRTEAQPVTIPLTIPPADNTISDGTELQQSTPSDVAAIAPVQNDADLGSASVSTPDALPASKDAAPNSSDTAAKSTNLAPTSAAPDRPPVEPPSPATAPPGANLDAQKTAKSVPVSKSPTPEGKAAQTASSNRDSSIKSNIVTDPWVAAEQELLRLPPSGFVLQLMAASTADAIRSYVALQPNGKNLRMYRSARNGKTLYIVVEGFYADKAAAQAAIVNLPEPQRRAGPWPKSLELIQREIRPNRS